MPHLITNMSERQVNPIFPSKKKPNNSMSAKARADSPEKNNRHSENLRRYQKRRRSGYAPKGSEIDFFLKP